MKWFKKVFAVSSKTKKEDVLKDIQGIIEFLEHAQEDPKVLLTEFRKLEELEKERQIASPHLVAVNLETQAKVLEKILQRYEFYQNDVDVAGLRLKRVAETFLKEAQAAGLYQLVKEKKKDMRWRFQW